MATCTEPCQEEEEEPGALGQLRPRGASVRHACAVSKPRLKTIELGERFDDKQFPNLVIPFKGVVPCTSLV